MKRSLAIDAGAWIDGDGFGASGQDLAAQWLASSNLNDKRQVKEL